MCNTVAHFMYSLDLKGKMAQCGIIIYNISSWRGMDATPLQLLKIYSTISGFHKDNVQDEEKLTCSGEVGTVLACWKGWSCIVFSLHSFICILNHNV